MSSKFPHFKQLLVMGLLALSLACGWLFAFQDTGIASAHNVAQPSSVQAKVGTNTVNKTRQRHHHLYHRVAGTVTASTATSLTITNAKGKASTFLVTSTTKFANITNPIAANTKVGVVYSVGSDGKLTALKIATKKSK